MAGYESLDSDLFGYILVWGNNFTAGIQNVYTAKYNSNKKVVPFEINFFFACLGLPLMLGLCWYKEDTYLVAEALLFNEAMPGLNYMCLLSGSFGIFIVMTSILTVTTGGPMALNVAGTLKDVGLTYVGFLFFDDIKPTISVITGLGISFTGALSILGLKY